jgi:hypothetical protein
VDARRLAANAAPRHATWPPVVVSVAFLFLFSPETGLAQGVGDNLWFVRTGATSGFILPANPYMTSVSDARDPIRWGQDLTVEIGRQTDGGSEWHQLYGIPSYGFGFSVASFRNDVKHARPMEAYTFFSWPFLRLSDRLDLTTDFGMGMSWHWKEVDDTTESLETKLGSDLNARIDWGFYLRYASTPRITIFTGIDYTHRSNGGMVQPDRGINVIGPKVAVQYSLARTPSPPLVVDRPPFHPTWEFIVGGAGGVKNVIERADPLTRGDFWTLDTTAAVQRQFYRFGKIAAGTDVTYDGSLGARIDGANTMWRADAGQRWAVGIYGGYEHIVGRFGAIVQVGEYVFRGFAASDSTRLYQRFGWRYHMSDRCWSTVAIRAIEGRKANALEFGVGYRMPLFEQH